MGFTKGAESLFSILAFFFLAVGCGSAGGGGGDSASPPVPATPAPPATPIAAGLLLPSAGTIYLGAYVNTSGLAHGNNPEAVAALETQIGRKLALENGYLPFSSKFGTRNQLDDYANGRIPIYSWNCGPSNAAIASGAYDASIRLQADSIKSFGWPVFVRYQWDPDLPSTSLGRSACYDPTTDNADKTFAATQFVAAWKHIHAIFVQDGTVNAVFLWTISSVGQNSLSYYPGDAVVDWVGMDAYDLSNTSLPNTLGATYALLAPFGKPIMISETGATGEAQTAFFTQAAATLQTHFPLVRAFLYYDAIGPQDDWRITTAAAPTFAQFSEDSYLAGRYARP
jgi:hypothetical protein